MPTDFDQLIDRRAIRNINQWKYFPEDVLPLWVADMSFRTPQPILDAVNAALDHGVLGYELPGPELFETVARRLGHLYGWTVAPEMIVAVQGVNAAICIAASVACQPGEGVLVQPPVFHHFIDFPERFGFVRQAASLQHSEHDRRIHYKMDTATVDSALDSEGARTAMFLLCNPHNPVGRAWTADELSPLVALCAEHDLILCSDEIHGELLLDGAHHTPAAMLPGLAERTITLIGPGKAFNMSGLHCAFAIIPNASLRQRFTAELERRVLEVNSLGLIAAEAAYSGACDEWLAELRAYLASNRDFVIGYIQSEMPAIHTTKPEATYLLWLDCSELIRSGRITGSPYRFFLEQAKVALHEGAAFGPGHEHFTRINFAYPRSILEQALERMKMAVTRQ
jgi:cystathionine beta-lyase